MNYIKTSSGLIGTYWTFAATCFFLLASLFGLLLRASWIWELPYFNFQYLLHAHSHIAILGWCFTVCIGAMILLFVPDEKAKQFVVPLILNILAGVGMAISFPIQGYGPVSITFSTLHVLLSYYLAWLILRSLPPGSDRLSVSLIRWSIYWMLFSTLGLWVMAPVMVLWGKSHFLYDSSIQLFLHFQFNGWFLLATIGLAAEHLERAGSHIVISRWILHALQLSIFLSFAVNVTWNMPSQWLVLLNVFAGLLQLAVFVPIIGRLWDKYRLLYGADHISSRMLQIGLISLAGKVLIQAVIAWPVIGALVFPIRNMVVGFIHLLMLGFVTLSLLAIIRSENKIRNLSPFKQGYVLLIVAFIGSELLIFYLAMTALTGTSFSSGYIWLFAVSALFPISVTFILINTWPGKRHQQKLT